jgi:hypothetical protein
MKLSYLNITKIKKSPKYYSSLLIGKHHSENQSFYPTKCETIKFHNSYKDINYRDSACILIGMLPFMTSNGTPGLLLLERGMGSFTRGSALPTASINPNENWKEAITRKVFEETAIITDPDEFNVSNVYYTHDNLISSVFCVSKRVRKMSALEGFIPRKETFSVIIGTDKNKLFFPIHQMEYDIWFNNMRR